MNERFKLLNCYIDNISLNDLLERFNQGFIITPNVDHLITLQHDKEFYQIYQNADFVIADSQIIVNVLRFILRKPLKEKICGSDFFPAFCEYHKNNPEITIFLLGGRPGAPEKAREMINSKVGREIIIGAFAPSMGFEKNEEECETIVEMINDSKAIVVAVGVGAPKQEKWLFKYKDKLKFAKIFMGIGVTIEFEAGLVKRSPKWISRIGLEWFYRIVQEPARLWKRYFIRDLPFFGMVFKQKLGLYKNPFEI